MKLINHTRIPISVIIDNKTGFIIAPKSTYILDDDHIHKLDCKQIYDSASFPIKKKEIHNICIYSLYELEHTSATTCIHIKREKLRVSLKNIYYDRVNVEFENAFVVKQTLQISNEDTMVMSLQKIVSSDSASDRFDHFILEPFIGSPLVAFPLIILGVCLSLVYGWVFALIYFTILYLFFSLGSLFTTKLVEKLFERFFKIESTKKEMARLLSKEMISKFFTDPKRDPNYGEIEID